MAGISMKTRVALFLYGTRNLAGCALALVGLALFFGGVISDWWLAIVAGLYAVGWLAVPSSSRLATEVQNEAGQTALTEAVETLIKKGGKRLPQEAVTRLQSIAGVVRELAPRLSAGQVAVPEVIALTNAVTRDLPQTVSNYLRLPPFFASMHAVEGGRTCKQLFLAQLDFLGEQLSKISESIYQRDAEAIVANGKFLQEKFQPVSFIGT
jgi:hypothetical protein